MNEKTKLMLIANIHEYLFNLLMSDNTNSFLVNLHALDTRINTLLPDYEYIREEFVEKTNYDLKNLKQKVDKIRQYLNEIDRELTVDDGPKLHELANLIFESHENDWGDNVYILNWLEHQAFYLSRDGKYEEAIPKFQEYLNYMNNNPFLYIKIWLAHDEYVECLHQCRHDPQYYEIYIDALRENIELYKPCHHRLQYEEIRAQVYLNEIVKN